VTLTPEQWQKLETQYQGKYKPLMTRDQLRSQFENHQPQTVQSVTFEPDRQILREIDFSHRRKGNQRIVDEEWSIVVGDVRALEDLVLECVDAGIDPRLYL